MFSDLASSQTIGRGKKEAKNNRKILSGRYSRMHGRAVENRIAGEGKEC